jgi:putative ABC transport system ATP-binding protein
MPVPLACHAAAIELSYPMPGGQRLNVLAIDELDIAAGRKLGIAGPSGAGKTSLIHVLTGIERAAGSCIRWGETDITRLRESARDAWRRDHVGLIFQDFHLFPGLSVLRNVTLPATFGGTAHDMRARALALLDSVGVAPDRHDVETLSRGERQRVAIARALLKAPPVVVADEPTASLDAASSRAVADLLFDAGRATTLLVVSHDPALLERLDQVIYLRNGRMTGPP